MRSLRAWFCWRRDLWRMRQDATLAYARWVNARYAYHDLAVVFGNEPGAWFDGPIGKAQDELMDRMHEYQDIAARIRRMEEVGPAWTT